MPTLPFPKPPALTQEQIRHYIDSEGVAFYAQHGWYLSKPIIPHALLDKALEGIKRYEAGQRDCVIDKRATTLDWSKESAQTIRVNGYLSLQVKAVRELLCHPPIAAIAAQLAVTPQIRLFHDRLIVKPGGLPKPATETGWHTDIAYWKTSTSQNLLTAWIPFQDCDEYNGSLAVIKGSHRWRPVNTEPRFFDGDENGVLPSNMKPAGMDAEPTVVRIKKGQVSFHHCYVLHRSVPNLSDHQRYALAVHLQDASNQYKHYYQANGRLLVHSNDLICQQNADGLPDYQDQSIFPLLFDNHARSAAAE